MQAEKNDNNEKTDGEKTETVNDVTPPTSITNELSNLKIEDGSASSTPSSPGGGESGNFLSSFKAFSKFGDPKSDGKLITLSQSDKWMKQAKVIDGKKITTTDTGIYFKKHKCVLREKFCLPDWYNRLSLMSFCTFNIHVFFLSFYRQIYETQSRTVQNIPRRAG